MKLEHSIRDNDSPGFIEFFVGSQCTREPEFFNQILRKG